ncbi:hypothetical protein ACJX0J_018082 [Zea mays]
MPHTERIAVIFLWAPTFREEDIISDNEDGTIYEDDWGNFLERMVLNILHPLTEEPEDGAALMKHFVMHSTTIIMGAENQHFWELGNIVINISEDIFAGFNCTLRGGNLGIILTQDHLRTTGLWGKILEILMGRSIAVYLLSWICVAVIFGLIISVARLYEILLGVYPVFLLGKEQIQVTTIFASVVSALISE